MKGTQFVMTVLAIAFFGTNVSAVPAYWSRQDYENGALYGVDAELDRPPSEKAAGQSALSSAPGEPDLEATFVSAQPWLSGVNFGAAAFDGSIALGSGFFGSSLSMLDYVPVRIEFSATDTTLCQTFRRDLGYGSAGVGVFPGSAWDISDTANPRRLNLCSVEDANLATSNLTWDPSDFNVGNREYLFIMLSDYDGAGTTYAGDNIYSGAGTMDIVYGFWPLVASGHTLLETLPAELTIDLFYVRNFRGIPDETEVTLSWSWNGITPAGFNIYAGTTPGPSTLVHTAAGFERMFDHTGLTPGVTYYYEIEAVDNLDVVLGKGKPFSIMAQSVSSGDISLVGFWHERGTYGDVWGYTETGTGNEYALICAREEGVSIIDLDATPPTEVGFIPSIAPGTDAKDVKIYQHYAIVVKESEPIQIVDISDVTNPVQVSTFTPDNSGSHNCLVEGDYLYVVGNHGTGGLEIVDISNPVSPAEVGSFQPFYYHDLDIRNDTICATGIYGDGIDLIDVASKGSPSLVTRFNYPGSGAHNAEYSFDGKYVFIGDEIGSSGNHTRVFDISDPLNISLVADIVVDPNAVVHNCYVHEDTLLIIGHYTEGVRVWNVADPTNPFEIAHYDTYLPAGYGYAGCWSVYPYYPSGRIVASDMQTGLYVFELGDPGEPSCCIGIRGNIDNDLGNQVDISDLVYFVDYSFGGGMEPSCELEADVNADLSVDVSDLIYLVDFSFGSGPAPEDCP